MRARVPDCDVKRIWWSGDVDDEVVGMYDELLKSEEVGMRMRDWRRCIVDGKCDV